MISVVNFILNKFGSFPQGVSKVVLHTRLNVYRESSGDFWFATNNRWCPISGQKQDLFHEPIRFSL